MDTTTTIDPRIAQLAEDVTVDAKVGRDVIIAGEPFDVTVTVTNRSTRPYEMWARCGIPAVVEVALRPRFNTPFDPPGSLPGIPGSNFSTLSASLRAYLQYGEADEPFVTMVDRLSPAWRSSDSCGGLQPMTLTAGASATGTLTGIVSPGPAWTGRRSLSVFTSIGLPEVAHQSYTATSTVTFEDDPTRMTAYYRAVTDAYASPAVMGWVATHQGPNPDWSGGGVPVEVEYRRGQWRIHMAANMSAGANADLVITTEHGSGRLIDIREVRDGADPSNDPDATKADPARETVFFHA